MSERVYEVPLPEPHPAFVLWRVFFEAYIATSSRKRAERMLRLVAEKLADEESLSQVFHIRPSQQREASRRARRQAAELYELYLPVFVALLPPE